MGKSERDPFDRSIPGYAEVSIWPEAPGFPEEIRGIWVYRDGGTVGVTIKGKNGKEIELFFERALGRLCYGEYHTASNAAYIKQGSKFEKEIFEYLEVARKRLNTYVFPNSTIETFNKHFNKAKIYSSM